MRTQRIALLLDSNDFSESGHHMIIVKPATANYHIMQMCQTYSHRSRLKTTINNELRSHLMETPVTFPCYPC